jgi:hypothetical protein
MKDFNFSAALYSLIAGAGYISTVHYEPSLTWWAGLVSAIAIALKAKLSPSKAEEI